MTGFSLSIRFSRFIHAVACSWPPFLFFFFKRFYLFSFRERGREGEREGEKHQCVVASCTPPTGDLVGNPGTCPDWESNRRPFGSQASTQCTEPHQLGLHFLLRPNNAPLYGQTSFCLFTLQLMGIWLVSTCWLLGMNNVVMNIFPGFCGGTCFHLSWVHP